ncbi:hypothetical protein [Amycolatopsis sp. NPDC059657]|uniref:hypothetical protein n=1 Tax=Amycolatopsis sp. NPDC059657 TaxID=3346899 RepID=UPI00367063F2
MTSWITAVVGAIGALAGAWGGQWIAARRDDRRWQREADREDLRWEREQAKLNLDSTLKWSEKRLEFYGKVLAVIDSTYIELQNFVGIRYRQAAAFSDGLPMMPRDFIDGHVDEIFQSVRLIASTRSVDLAEELLSNLKVTISKLRHPTRAATPTHDMNQKLVNNFGQRIEELREQFRNDLGVNKVSTP